MARPRRRTRPNVSLFPFLSILACVIGTLILVITASATSQVASGGIDLERYEELEEQTREQRRRLAELTDLAQELGQLAHELDAASEHARELEARRAAQGVAPALDPQQRDSLRSAEARVAALERELEPLRAENARLHDALARHKSPQGAAPIRLRASGSGLGLDPHFVECRPEGIVIYADQGRERREIPAQLIHKSPEYGSFLRNVLFRSNASAIFLVREGGVGSCEQARGLARRQRVRFGEMPLVGSGELDFEALRGGARS